MAIDESSESALLAWGSDDGTVSIVLVGSVWEVRVGPLLVDSFGYGDVVEERLGIVRLVKSGLLTQRVAGVTFGVSHQRVGQLVKAFDLGGTLALFPKEKGRRMQISVRARARLIDHVENRGRGVSDAARRVMEEIGEYIGDDTAYKIIGQARGGISAEEQVWGTPAVEAKLASLSAGSLRELASFLGEDDMPDQEDLAGQRAEPDSRPEGCDAVGVSGAQHRLDAVSSVVGGGSPAANMLPSQVATAPQNNLEPAFEPAARGREEAYRKTLEDGVRVPYLGGFLVSGLVGQLGLGSIFRRVAAEVALPLGGQQRLNRFWDLPRILMTLVFIYLFRFHSIETMKTADRVALGLLVGAPRAPDIKSVRRWLVEAAKSRIGEKLGFLLATGYAALGWVRLGTLYLDGHFRPYYGSRKIASGWFSGRNVGHPGNYEYFVNDERGRPVFLEMTAASVSFTKIIPKLVADAKRLREEVKAKGPLIVVLDRGAYSADLFAEIDRQDAVYVTWMKTPPKFVRGYFSQRISVEFTKTHRTFFYFETRVKINGYADSVKAFAIYDPKTDHQMVIITNSDRVRPGGKRTRIDHARLIRALVKRWVQENFFKEAKSKMALDQHAGYLFEAEDPLAQVVNPARKKLTATRRELERLLSPINEALAALDVPRPPGLTRHVRGAPARDTSPVELRRQRQKLLLRLGRVRAKLGDTPEHVPHRELPEEKKRLVTLLDKQTILQHLKAASHNLTEMLAQEFKQHCYFDPRDPKPVLFDIFKQPAYCQLRGSCLHIYPKPLDVDKYQSAAERLYDIVNDASGRTSDSFGFTLHIHGGPPPENVSW